VSDWGEQAQGLKIANYSPPVSPWSGAPFWECHQYRSVEPEGGSRL